MLRAAACPCRCATTQCSTRIRSPRVRVGPARDVARRVDARHARLEVLVHRHARSIASPACSASASRGRTPTPITTRSASSRVPSSSTTASCSMRCRLAAEMEHDALLLVQRLDERRRAACRARARAACFGRDDVRRRRPRARSDAATSRPMKLAPIDDGALRLLRRGDDRAAVGERAQVVHVRQIARRGVRAGSARRRWRAAARRTRSARGLRRSSDLLRSVEARRAARARCRCRAPRRSRRAAAGSTPRGALPAR